MVEANTIGIIRVVVNIDVVDVVVNSKIMRQEMAAVAATTASRVVVVMTFMIYFFLGRKKKNQKGQTPTCCCCCMSVDVCTAGGQSHHVVCAFSMYFFWILSCLSTYYNIPRSLKIIVEGCYRNYRGKGERKGGPRSFIQCTVGPRNIR
jgi:hypothetical protein